MVKFEKEMKERVLGVENGKGGEVRVGDVKESKLGLK